LSLDGVFAGAEVSLDTEVLLDRFEKSPHPGLALPSFGCYTDYAFERQGLRSEKIPAFAADSSLDPLHRSLQ
jgi:hypothetical protein